MNQERQIESLWHFYLFLPYPHLHPVQPLSWREKPVPRVQNLEVPQGQTVFANYWANVSNLKDWHTMLVSSKKVVHIAF